MDSHDTLSFRLADILVKLNNGEKLDPHQLAQEYKVNLRTIQRDLNQLAERFPLENNGASPQGWQACRDYFPN